MKQFPVLFFAVLMLVFTQCKQQVDIDHSTTNINDFKSYIASYGQAELSKMGPLKMKFHDDVVASMAADPTQYIKIIPAVAGTAELTDDGWYVFTPTKGFESDTPYQVQIDMANLFEQDELQTAQFSCKTRAQSASLNLKEIDINQHLWKVDIDLDLQDQERIEDLEKVIEVRGANGSKIGYKLVQQGKRSAYTMHLDDIQAKDKAQEITVEWKGAKDADNHARLQFDVPSKSSFSLVTMDHESNHKLVHYIFNQRLDQGQDVTRLLDIKGRKKPLEYTIDNNKLSVFYTGVKPAEIILREGLKSENGLVFNKLIKQQVGSGAHIPKLSVVGVGHILPQSSNRTIFPFKAEGLQSIRLNIFKIHANNLSQFYLRYNTFESNDNRYLGEEVHEQRIALSDIDPKYNPNQESIYYLDLKKFIETDPNAVYEIRIGFFADDVDLDCAQKISSDDLKSDPFKSYYGNDIYRNDDYSYRRRKDPCAKEFYSSRKFIRKIVMVSDLGVIAKKSLNGQLDVAISNLNTCAPISGAKVQVYNLAQRELIQSKTDAKGLLRIKDMDQAHLLRCSFNGSEQWLSLSDNKSLSMTSFDVSGRKRSNGVDGMIYGERDIWRPGDSLYMHFMLFDPEQSIPQDHPLKWRLYNPDGVVVFQQSSSKHLGPIYPMTIATSSSYKTGDYRIQAQLGNSSFTKYIKIEFFKPNKFALEADIASMKEARISSIMRLPNASMNYKVKWLHGAPAKNKKVDVELNIQRARTSFAKYPEYQFTDHRNTWRQNEPIRLASVKTDENGSVNIPLKLEQKFNPPGKVVLKFKNTIHEQSGDFSTDAFAVPLSPYIRYAGLQLPKNIYGSKRVDRSKETSIKFLSVDSEGKPQRDKKLEVSIFKMEHSWWMNSYNDEFDVTNMKVHVNQDRFSVVTDANGKANKALTFKTYGRYLVKVCDPTAGHCASDYLYVGYAWDDGTMSSEQYAESAKLHFKAKKASYEVGDKVALHIPSYFKGKVLLSLENGSGVIQQSWKNIKHGNNTLEFEATEAMFPTVYAHVSMIQAHDDKANDMPIRSYGVLPIPITQADLKLQPVIKCKEEVKPKSKLEITVKEKNRKAMYYSLAVVDEGLLNVTRYKTPDPMALFYQKPSLGVRTYDLYNEVMSAYGKDMKMMYSVGGDMASLVKDGNEKANRFKSVVQVLGPFKLEKGAKQTHAIQLPSYMGAVRVMVVAGNKRAFGQAEKTVEVKQDLMMLASLPRRLMPGDEFAVPLTFFAQKANIGSVQYGVDAGRDLLSFDAGRSQIQLEDQGEKLGYLPVRVGTQLGVEKLKFFAQSNRDKVEQAIEIDVENPNPIQYNRQLKTLAPGASLDLEVLPYASHEARYAVGVSSLSPVQVDDLVDRLTQYPYGCLEQRTSAAMAILLREQLTEVSTADKLYGQQIVQDLLYDLYQFKSERGYLLWPSSYASHDAWLTSYMGQFLTLAKAQGYALPNRAMEQWVSDQKALATQWKLDKNWNANYKGSSIYNQIYRLYTLAEAGYPLLSEMNRLREDYKLDGPAQILLAGAYALAGQDKTAKSMLHGRPVVQSAQQYYAYGSDIRDLALYVIVYNQIGDKDKQLKALLRLNKKLKETDYLSTQSSSFVVQALARANGNKHIAQGFQVEIQEDNQQAKLFSQEQGSMVMEREQIGTHKLRIKNKGKTTVYVDLVRSGKMGVRQEESAAQAVQMTTKYMDLDYNPIDPSTIQQGTDFIMSTQVSRSGSSGASYDNMVLRQVIPSGWEIENDRIFDINSNKNKNLVYQDYRDAQVNSFFSLNNKASVTVNLRLKASFPGKYYLPMMLVEHMYDADIYARAKGFACEVVR